MAKTNASPARARKSATRTTTTPAAPKATKTVRPRAKAGTTRLPKAVTLAIKAARDKKADDVVVLDLRKAGGFTDFFIICSGNNARQIAAIADAVRETLKAELGERPALAEGVDRSEWVLLDYFNFVVHIFSRECRAFYGLERLWGNAERHEFVEDARADTART